jgi:hypothetical protein
LRQNDGSSDHRSGQTTPTDLVYTRQSNCAFGTEPVLQISHLPGSATFCLTASPTATFAHRQSTNPGSCVLFQQRQQASADPTASSQSGLDFGNRGGPDAFFVQSHQLY